MTGAPPRRPTPDPALERVRRRVDRLGRLSDGLIRLGPIKIGLDGILAWAPGLGEVYSLTAGALLAREAHRVQAPPSVLARVLLLVGLRSLAGAPAAALLGPLYPASGLIVDLFRAHRMAADLILKEMDRSLYIGAEAPPAEREEAEAVSRREGLRLVVLRPRRSRAAGRSPVGR